jgi:hypothetical protein
MRESRSYRSFLGHSEMGVPAGGNLHHIVSVKDGDTMI